MRTPRVLLHRDGCKRCEQCEGRACRHSDESSTYVSDPHLAFARSRLRPAQTEIARVASLG